MKLPAEEFILSQTGITMSLFFIMSGYCLYKSTGKIETFLAVKEFYQRRALRLLPVYWIVEIYLLIIVFVKNVNVAHRLRIFPVRLLCMQIHYNSSIFGGVGWFISCLMTCYILYSIIFIAVNAESKKIRLLFVGSIVFLLFYTSLLENWVGGLDTYYNPYFRFLEFAFCIIIAKFSSAVFRNIKRYHAIIFLIVCMASLLCIEMILHNSINNYVKYFLLGLIIFSVA